MRREDLKKLFIAMAGVGCICLGYFGNLSHNEHHTAAYTSASLNFAEESREAEREAEKEAEIALETAKPKVEQTQTSYHMELVLTSAEINHTEPHTEPTTTTAEEVTTESETEPTEPYIEPTAPPEPIAPAVPDFTADEVLLMRVASCEGFSQGPTGQALVMRVILNRCAKSGLSVADVVYAPRQFKATTTELFASGYISPDAYEALSMIRAGWDGSNGACYFIAKTAYNPNSWFGTLQYCLTYGDHMFFK